MEYRYKKPMLTGRLQAGMDPAVGKEEPLLKQLERLQQMADMINDGVLIFEKREAVFINRRAEEITGYTQDELGRMRGLAMALPGERERLAWEMAEQKHLVPEKGINYWITRKDGQKRYINARFAKSEVEVKRNIGRFCIFIRDITDLKKRQEQAEDRDIQLKTQALDLTKFQNALDVLLKKREEERQQLELYLAGNLHRVVKPLLSDLKACCSQDRQLEIIDRLAAALNNLLTPFTDYLTRLEDPLSAMEIRVAHLVKDGKTNKEIARILNLSTNTIIVHRHRIRTKLGIKNRKINLKSHLLSLEG